MRISKKQLANYLNVHPTRVKKHYQCYLDALEITNRDYLTIFDIHAVDNIPLAVLSDIFNIPVPLAKISNA